MLFEEQFKWMNLDEIKWEEIFKTSTFAHVVSIFVIL